MCKGASQDYSGQTRTSHLDLCRKIVTTMPANRHVSRPRPLWRQRWTTTMEATWSTPAISTGAKKLRPSTHTRLAADVRYATGNTVYGVVSDSQQQCLFRISQDRWDKIARKQGNYTLRRRRQISPAGAGSIRKTVSGWRIRSNQIAMLTSKRNNSREYLAPLPGTPPTMWARTTRAESVVRQGSAATKSMPPRPANGPFIEYLLPPKTERFVECLGIAPDSGPTLGARQPTGASSQGGNRSIREEEKRDSHLILAQPPDHLLSVILDWSASARQFTTRPRAGPAV